MAGGGTDVDQGMQWFVNRTSTTTRKGDVVVLRASGSNGYNSYLVGMGANSVTSIVFQNGNGASSQEVLNIVGDAEGIFFAGGDQELYVRYWADTPLSNLLTSLISRNVVFGGTSAGLAIQGQWIYTGAVCSVTSPQALANPYNSCMSFASQFIPLPYMSNIITDSHEKQRDRMGRTATFISRMFKDGISGKPIGIGVDEATDILLDSNGVGVAVGSGSAYIITLSSPLQSFTCANATPLTVVSVNGIRLDGPKGSTYNFVTGANTGATSYSFNVTNGNIQGSPYGPGSTPVIDYGLFLKER